MSNTNQTSTTIATLAVVTIIAIILACASVDYSNNKIERMRNEHFDKMLSYDIQRKTDSNAMAKYERTIQHLAESQVHQYTMIDDRYLIRISIYDLKTIIGPIWAFDNKSEQHILLKVNRTSVFRQPTWREIAYKFQSLE